MDWNAAIEKNREALKRILAALVAMAELITGPHPEVRSLSQSEGEPRRTLPRRLRNAVLRLLRPAEAAARRLVIVAARDIAVTLPRARKARPKPIAVEPILRSLGLAVVLSPADVAARAAADRRAAAQATKSRPARPAFPLFDPLRRWNDRSRSRHAPTRAVPRILSFGDRRPAPIPPLPSPDDPLDATRIGLRLQALASVLDDLPAQAQRFARWQARRDAAFTRNGEHRHSAGRMWPLKPGSPPGLPRPETLRRRPPHEVHDILRVTHGLAFWTLERRDTS